MTLLLDLAVELGQDLKDDYMKEFMQMQVLLWEFIIY
jgi:hypothetical protein